jgi:hypothetical protein
MKIVATGLFLVLVLTPVPGGGKRDEAKPARNVEVSGIIVDGLGRPVPGVTVTFSYYEGPYDAFKWVTLANFTTDDSGRYAGVVHDWAPSQRVSSFVSKSGYEQSCVEVSASEDYEWSRVKNSRFAILRNMPYGEAVQGLLELQGNALDQHLLEVLASTAWRSSLLWGGSNIEDVLFADPNRFHASLHRALENPHVWGNAWVFLEFLGEPQDPNDPRSIPDAYRSTPKIAVAAPGLGEAVRAVAEAYELYWREGEKILIDKTVFTQDSRMAMVRCHVHHGFLADRGYKLRFEKVGDKWVLKAFTSPWVS